MAKRLHAAPPVISPDTVPTHLIPSWNLFFILFFSSFGTLILLFHPLLGTGIMNDEFFAMYHAHFHPLEYLSPGFSTLNGYTYYRPIGPFVSGLLYSLFGLSNSTPFQLTAFAINATIATTAGLISWHLWKSKLLAVLSSLLFATALLQFTTLASLAWITDTGWILSFMLTVGCYLTGQTGKAAIAYGFAITFKESSLITVPLLIAYEWLPRLAQPHAIRETANAVWKKQKWLLLLMIFHAGRIFLISSSDPIITEVTKFWGPHIWENFLLGLQHMIPFHSGEGGEHYGQRPVIRQAVTAMILLAPVFAYGIRLTLQRHRDARIYQFFILTFLAAFFPWSFLVQHEQPHYLCVSMLAMAILLPHSLVQLTQQSWAPILLVIAAALSTSRSLEPLRQSHHMTYVMKDADIILHQIKELAPHPPHGRIFLFDRFEGSMGKYNGNFWRTHTILKSGAFRLLYDDPSLRVLDAQRDLRWVKPNVARIIDFEFYLPRKGGPSKIRYDLNPTARVDPLPRTTLGKPWEVYDVTPSSPLTVLRYEKGVLTDVTKDFFPNAASAFEHYQQGLDFQRRQQHDAALQEFSSALSLITGFPEIYAAMSQSFLAKQQYQEAGKTAQAAVQADPNNATFWYYLNLVYQRVGNFDQAEHALGQAYQLDPSMVVKEAGFSKLEAARKMASSGPASR